MRMLVTLSPLVNDPIVSRVDRRTYLVREISELPLYVGLIFHFECEAP